MFITDAKRITLPEIYVLTERLSRVPMNSPTYDQQTSLALAMAVEVTRDPGSLRVLASFPLPPPLRFAFQLSHQQIDLLYAATVNSSSRHNSGKPRRADTPCSTAVMVLILLVAPSPTLLCIHLF